MNADELAKEMDDACIEFVGDVWIPTFKSVASMLRQQADRIAELEKQGKPVAWMSPDGKVSTTEGILFHIPLYTTPLTKPLSDEEIWNWFKENTALTKESALRIARAIEERHGIK